MSNEDTIVKFYSAFAKGDFTTMRSCYHPEITFNDPAFGDLKKDSVPNMWEMLLLNSKGHLIISFSNIHADDMNGGADWQATYHFSKTGRKVVNKIQAKFEFKDGLIIRHTDYFDFWKWSRQAFGITGYLLGWTTFFHKKVNQQARQSLAKFEQKKAAIALNT
jgi:ketosteroid isomerase-like protein